MKGNYDGWGPGSVRYYGAVLARCLRPLAVEVAVLTGLLIVSILLQLAQPQVIRAFIDAATGTGQAAGRCAGSRHVSR